MIDHSEKKIEKSQVNHDIAVNSSHFNWFVSFWMKSFADNFCV